jgi:hypothetical protein
MLIPKSLETFHVKEGRYGCLYLNPWRRSKTRKGDMDAYI